MGLNIKLLVHGVPYGQKNGELTRKIVDIYLLFMDLNRKFQKL